MEEATKTTTAATEALEPVDQHHRQTSRHATTTGPLKTSSKTSKEDEEGPKTNKQRSSSCSSREDQRRRRRRRQERRNSTSSVQVNHDETTASLMADVSYVSPPLADATSATNASSRSRPTMLKGLSLRGLLPKQMKDEQEAPTTPPRPRSSPDLKAMATPTQSKTKSNKPGMFKSLSSRGLKTPKSRRERRLSGRNSTGASEPADGSASEPPSVLPETETPAQPTTRCSRPGMLKSLSSRGLKTPKSKRERRLSGRHSAGTSGMEDRISSSLSDLPVTETPLSLSTTESSRPGMLKSLSSRGLKTPKSKRERRLSRRHLSVPSAVEASNVGSSSDLHLLPRVETPKPSSASRPGMLKSLSFRGLKTPRSRQEGRSNGGHHSPDVSEMKEGKIGHSSKLPVLPGIEGRTPSTTKSTSRPGMLKSLSSRGLKTPRSKRERRSSGGHYCAGASEMEDIPGIETPKPSSTKSSSRAGMLKSLSSRGLKTPKFRRERRSSGRHSSTVDDDESPSLGQTSALSSGGGERGRLSKIKKSLTLRGLLMDHDPKSQDDVPGFASLNCNDEESIFTLDETMAKSQPLKSNRRSGDGRSEVTSQIPSMAEKLGMLRKRTSRRGPCSDNDDGPPEEEDVSTFQSVLVSENDASPSTTTPDVSSSVSSSNPESRSTRMPSSSTSREGLPDFGRTVKSPSKRRLTAPDDYNSNVEDEKGTGGNSRDDSTRKSKRESNSSAPASSRGRALRQLTKEVAPQGTEINSSSLCSPNASTTPSKTQQLRNEMARAIRSQSSNDGDDDDDDDGLVCDELVQQFEPSLAASIRTTSHEMLPKEGVKPRRSTRHRPSTSCETKPKSTSRTPRRERGRAAPSSVSAELVSNQQHPNPIGGRISSQISDGQTSSLAASNDAKEENVVQEEVNKPGSGDPSPPESKSSSVSCPKIRQLLENGVLARPISLSRLIKYTDPKALASVLETQSEDESYSTTTITSSVNTERRRASSLGRDTTEQQRCKQQHQRRGRLVQDTTQLHKGDHKSAEKPENVEITTSVQGPVSPVQDAAKPSLERAAVMFLLSSGVGNLPDVKNETKTFNQLLWQLEDSLFSPDLAKEGFQSSLAAPISPDDVTTLDLNSSALFHLPDYWEDLDGSMQNEQLAVMTPPMITESSIVTSIGCPPPSCPSSPSNSDEDQVSADWGEISLSPVLQRFSNKKLSLVLKHKADRSQAMAEIKKKVENYSSVRRRKMRRAVRRESGEGRPDSNSLSQSSSSKQF